MEVTKATPEYILERMVELVQSSVDFDIFSVTRREDVVLCRAAIFVASRGLMSSARIAERFGKNHATVLHHTKNHEMNATIEMYRKLYEDLMYLRSQYDVSVRSKYQDLSERLDALMVENEELRAEIRTLKIDLLKKGNNE